MYDRGAKFRIERGRSQAITLWLAGLLAVFASASTASASPSARLVYARATDASRCGDEAALRRAVASRLGYDPFVAMAQNEVVAELRGDGEGLKARVFVIEAGSTVGGARELGAPTKDCAELMLAVALAISIAIDPESIERVVESRPQPEPNPAPESVRFEPVPPGAGAKKAEITSGSVSPLNARATWIWRVGIAGAIASGPTPLAAWQLGGSLVFGSRHWSLGLEPRWTLPSKTELQAGTGAQAKTEMVSATLAPCYHLDAWQGCLLAELGRLSSQGEVARSQRDSSLWAASGLRLAYRWGGIDGLGVTAMLDGLYSLNRISLLLNARSVHDTPWILGRLGIGLDYAF